MLEHSSQRIVSEADPCDSGCDISDPTQVNPAWCHDHAREPGYDDDKRPALYEEG